jgi:hypothetical protein
VEYLAFGLLGLGAIFILIGITSARQEKIKGSNEATSPVSLLNTTARQTENHPQELRAPEPVPEPVMVQKPIQPTNTIRTNTPITHVNPVNPVIAVKQETHEDNAPKPEFSEKNEKNKMSEENEKKEHPVKNVKINKTGEHALFFKESAVLYVDRNRHNIYEDSQLSYRLLNTGNIHRIGPGKISFDGFNFFFEDKTVRETYRLSEIDRLYFYPNCFTITKKQTGLTSIFFIDSTERIKAALENHKMIHASQ